MAHTTVIAPVDRRTNGHLPFLVQAAEQTAEAAERQAAIESADRYIASESPAVAELLAGDRARDEERTQLAAAGLYAATAAYDEALRRPNPTATLDNMCDAVHEISPALAKVINDKPSADFAEGLRAATADCLWTFTAIEHARAELGNDYGYVLDIMADRLKRGLDPKAVRAEVPRVVERLRAEHTIATAVDAITEAVTGALAGLTTNPRDVAERLHTAIDDAQAEHLAHVGDMSLERAEAAEAFSTATYAMARALSLSPDPAGTALGLRTALRMSIDEARA